MIKCSFRRIALPILVGLIAVLYTSSCEKQQEDVTSNHLEVAESLPMLQFSDDGLVFFKDLDEFKKFYAAVEHATRDELMAWQETNGFQSINFLFEETWTGLCCDVEEEDIKKTPSLYPNVRVTEDGEILPLINAGLMGWIIGREGQFKLGRSLITITNDAVISVLDGDANKTTLAIRTLESNEAEGIFVRMQDNESSARACCPSSSINTGTVRSGSKRIKTASMSLADRSFAASFPTGVDQYGNFIYSTGYQLIYEMDYFFHHQRKTFFGWTVCERTYWSFDSQWNLVHNLPSIWGYSNPIIGAINNFETGFECKYNRTDGIIFVPFV
ncbi:hypothetical protein, partial [Phaeodactylibacter luteus]